MGKRKSDDIGAAVDASSKKSKKTRTVKEPGEFFASFYYFSLLALPLPEARHPPRTSIKHPPHVPSLFHCKPSTLLEIIICASSPYPNHDIPNTADENLTFISTISSARAHRLSLPLILRISRTTTYHHAFSTHPSTEGRHFRVHQCHPVRQDHRIEDTQAAQLERWRSCQCVSHTFLSPQADVGRARAGTCIYGRHTTRKKRLGASRLQSLKSYAGNCVTYGWPRFGQLF